MDTYSMSMDFEQESMVVYPIQEAKPEEDSAGNLPTCVKDMIISYTLWMIWRGLEEDSYQLGRNTEFRDGINRPEIPFQWMIPFNESARGKSYLWSSLVHFRNRQKPFSGASEKEKLEYLEGLRALERADAQYNTKTWKSRVLATATIEQQVRSDFLSGMRTLIDAGRLCNSRLQYGLFNGTIRPPYEDIAECINLPESSPSPHFRAWLRSEIEESVELIPARWLSIFGHSWN